MDIAYKLAYLKKRDGLTTRTLSEFSGVPVGTLNKILNGATRSPSILCMARLAAVFRVPVRYFTSEQEDCELDALSPEYGLITLNEIEHTLLMRFRALNSRQQTLVRNMTDSLADMDELLPTDTQQTLDLFCYTPSHLEPAYVRTRMLRVQRITVLADAAARAADYALVLWGCALEPLYSPGTLLGVRRGDVRHGELGVFVLNEQGCVRRYYDARGRRRLDTVNCAVPNVTIQPQDSLRCIGTLTGVLTPGS